MLDLNKLVKLFIIGIIIILSLKNVLGSYNVIKQERWSEVGNYLNTNGKQGDLIVFYPGDDNILFIFNYYSKRKDFIKKPVNEYINNYNIKELLLFVKKYKRVWFIQRIKDHKGIIKKTFTGYYDLLFYKNFKSGYFKEGNEDIELSLFKKNNNL